MRSVSSSFSSPSLFFFFLKVCGKLVLLNIWWNLPVKPSGPGFFFVGSFWLPIRILYLLLMVYLYFLFLLDLVSEICVSRNLSISSKLSSIGIRLFIVFLYNLFISVKSLVMSPLSFLILIIQVFFFLGQSPQVCQFCWSFQSPSLGFVNHPPSPFH